MRIVAGTYKGRRLEAPAGRDVRPTSDRVREALFNILSHGLDAELEDAAVLDVFAGTGAMGLEALSRGARRATFLDNDPIAIRFVQRNAGAVGAARDVTVVKLDVTMLAAPPLVTEAPCAFAFLDPPYGSGLAAPALEGLLRRMWIGTGTVCTVEVGSKEAFAPPPGFNVLDERRYGAARVVFLTVE